MALSDDEKILASPLPVYSRRNLDVDLAFLLGIVKENEVERAIVGLPRNMNGSIGKTAKEVLSFADKLQRKINIPVSTFDERMTSVEAERVLVETNLSRKRRKGLRDSIAAVLILQGYLDRLGTEISLHRGRGIINNLPSPPLPSSRERDVL
jgi:putative Holliday junction resolvase